MVLPGGDGTVYNMSNASQRMAVTTWYLKQVQARATAAHWTELTLYGVYDQREDASIAYGDPAYLQSMNAEAHSLGLSTIWVPYYDAPDAFSGASLGFNVTVIQPEYSFRDAQYEGVVNDSRLYSAGYKAAGQGQATEYEVSSQGNSPTEQQIAHQYLAVAQFTGAAAHPQVFFDGLSSDIFDQVSSQSAVDASEWQTYTDLVNYLRRGGHRQHRHRRPVVTCHHRRRRAAADLDPGHPGRRHLLPGRLQRPHPGQPRGGDRSPSPSPAPAAPAPPTRCAPAPTASTRPTTRSWCRCRPPPPATTPSPAPPSPSPGQAGSPWPNIMRVVAATADPPMIANGNYGATSTSTALSAASGKYADSQPTYQGYYAGKLTDGQISASGTWGWSGDMGWNSESGPFSVTINLGKPAALGSVKLITHADQGAGVNWPSNLSASIGATCAPQNAGHHRAKLYPGRNLRGRHPRLPPGGRRRPAPTTPPARSPCR